jgi:hypothetical protein
MRILLAALAATTVSFTFITPAQAGFSMCAGKEGSKLEKCEVKALKNLAKRRTSTTAYKPSDLDKGFGHLDGDDVNPFNTDHHYFGVKDTGFEKLNEVAAAANKISAAVRMANYVGDLNKTDKAAAQKLGGTLLPILKGLDASVKDVTEQAKALAASPNDLVASPMELTKAVGAVGGIVTQLGGTAARIPGALTALMPIVKGAAAAAVENAVGDATDAVNDAAGGALDKAGIKK